MHFNQPYEDALALSSKSIAANQARKAVSKRVLSASESRFLDQLQSLIGAPPSGTPLGPSANPYITHPNHPPIYSIQEAAKLPRPAFLVDSLIPSASITFLYGDRGVGKSFACLDLAASVARGVPFLGNDTRQGPVIYISAEGLYGIRNRVNAYMQHCMTPAETQIDFPLWLVPDAPQLNQRSGVERLALALYTSFLTSSRQLPVLIILDTLNACMATADENSAAEIGQFLLLCNTIRQNTGAAIVVVHHLAKADLNKPRPSLRGHTSLAGAADTMICATRVKSPAQNKLVELICTKQKDADEFTPIQYELKPVTLNDGETSCIIAQIQNPQTASTTKTADRKAGRARGALHVLINAQKPLTTADWLDACSRTLNISASTFYRYRALLEKEQLITLDSGHYQPTGKAMTPNQTPNPATPSQPSTTPDQPHLASTNASPNSDAPSPASELDDLLSRTYMPNPGLVDSSASKTDSAFSELPATLTDSQDPNESPF
jgi:archaellum biogenesis ATPase FlaH